MNKFYFLKRHDSGLYILGFYIGRFSCDCFTDCGDWFVYFHWHGKDWTRVIRLSSAGCYDKTYARRNDDN